MAEIEEAKDINTIQILDRAVPPDNNSGPKRALIVVLSTAVAFFMAVLTAFFIEFIDRIKADDPDRYQRLIHSTWLRKYR
jgi:uncharacterized protein involved in exopolysaccharide biosynthesis